MVDPINNRLWDLQPALRHAAKCAGIALYGRFTSHRYLTDLLEMGLSIVHFGSDSKRELGLHGDDLSELLAEHTLHTSTGEIRNGARQFILENDFDPSVTISQELAYETGQTQTHQRIERNLGNARKVKQTLGLTCQGCGL